MQTTQRIPKKDSIFRSPELLLMALPSLLLLIIFRYLPIANIVVAFKNYNIFAGIWESPWAGFTHFQKLLQSPDFYTILKNTFLISGYKIIFGFPAPIILAFLLNEVKSKSYKGACQNIYYLPYFLSWVVIAGLCFDVFSVDGILNSVWVAFGGEPISYLMSQQHFRSLLVISDIWKSAGWGSIVYLAALTSIDPGLYEAAKIDGANKLKQAVHITLPGIAPVIIVMFIIRLSTILDAGAEQILMMYNPMVMDVADVIDTYVFRQGISGAKYDFTTAVGLFKSLVAMVFVLSANKIVKKVRGEGIW
jgi:putative aldouronate transport system permease protein